MISLWLLRQVEYPDSRTCPIFVLEVIVPGRQNAVFRTEFIVHSKPAIMAGAVCYGPRGEFPVTS